MQPSPNHVLHIRGPLQRGRSSRSWLFSWPTVIVLLVVFGVLASGAWGAYRKDRLAREKLSEAAHEYEAMRARYDTLVEETQMLATPEGKEAAVRAAYDVGKAGEELVVIVDDAPLPEAPREAPSTVERFFGIFE